MTPKGGKQWVQRIMIRGKRCELGLGSPPAVTLAMARKVALEHHGTAMLGGDPLADKRAAKDVLSFAEAVDAYLEAKLSAFKNAKHRQQWRNTLVTYALPKLGRKPVRDIDLQDVLEVLQPIWLSKTETASRVRGRIESVLSWAAVRGYRSGDNPARWKGNLSELLPKPSKVAKVTNQPSLSQGDAAALLQSVPRLQGNNLVFHAARGGTLSDASLSAVMKRMHAAKVEKDGVGYVDMASQRPAVPHGLRSTFRVWATEQGYDHRMAEIALAHWQGDETERAYQRSDMLERRRAMMESWAAFLDGQGSAKLNVVELGAFGRA